jgi:hypothetical protein
MKTFVTLSIIFSLIIFIGCQSQPGNENAKANSDSSIVAKKGKRLRNEPIPDTVWVRQCITDYQSIYGQCSDQGIKASHSEIVTYEKAALLKWLNDVSANSNCDNLRIYFGVYPSASSAPPIGVDIKGVQNIKPNRLTVFIWPYYKDGVAKYNAALKQPPGNEDVPPYDLGEIYP